MKDEGRRMKDERHHTLSFWKQNKEQTNHHVHFFRRERDFCKRRPEACCLKAGWPEHRLPKQEIAAPCRMEI